MIKFMTLEGRTVYINPASIAALEINGSIVHIRVGDFWFNVKESEDEVVEKLFKSSLVVPASRPINDYERF